MFLVEAELKRAPRKGMGIDDLRPMGRSAGRTEGETRAKVALDRA